MAKKLERAMHAMQAKAIGLGRVGDYLSKLNSLGPPTAFSTTRLSKKDSFRQTDGSDNIPIPAIAPSHIENSQHTKQAEIPSLQHTPGPDTLTQQAQNLGRELELQEYTAKSIDLFEAPGKAARLYRSMPSGEAKAIVVSHWDSLKHNIPHLNQCIANPENQTGIHDLLQQIHQHIFENYFLHRVSPGTHKKRKQMSDSEADDSAGSYDDQRHGNKYRLAKDGDGFRPVTPEHKKSNSSVESTDLACSPAKHPTSSTPCDPGHRRRSRITKHTHNKDVEQDLDLAQIAATQSYIATIDTQIETFSKVEGHLKELESDLSSDTDRAKQMTKKQKHSKTEQSTDSEAIESNIYLDITCHPNQYEVLSKNDTAETIALLDSINTTSTNTKPPHKRNSRRSPKTGTKRTLDETTDKPIKKPHGKKGKHTDSGDPKEAPQRHSLKANQKTTKTIKEKKDRSFFIPTPTPGQEMPTVQELPPNFSNEHRIVNVPSDGHCILHAVIKSFNHQHGHESTLPDLMKALREEAEKNAEDYFIPLDDYSKKDYLAELDDYLTHKRYSTKFGDTVVLLCEKVLGISLNIVQVASNKIEFLENQRPGNTNPKVYIYKGNDHYKAFERKKVTQKPKPMEVVDLINDTPTVTPLTPEDMDTKQGAPTQGFQVQVSKNTLKRHKRAARPSANTSTHSSHTKTTAPQTPLHTPKTPTKDPPRPIPSHNTQSATNKTVEAPKHQLPAFHLPRGIQYPLGFQHRICVENPELQGKLQIKPTKSVGHILLPNNLIVANRLKAPILFQGRYITLTQVGAEKWKPHTVRIAEVPKWDAFNSTKHIYNHEGVLLVKPIPITRTANTKRPTYELIIKYRSSDTVPPFIPINGVKYPTKDKEPVSTRCFKCQKDKHTQATCKSPTHICAFCAGEHRSKICHDKLRNGIPVIFKCVNCGGDHPASSPKCKAFQKQQERSQPDNQPSKKPPALMDLTFTHRPAQRTQAPQQPRAPPSKPPTDNLAFTLTLTHTPDNHWDGNLRTTLTLLKYMRGFHPHSALAIDNVAAKLAGAPGREYLRGNALYSAKVQNIQAPQKRRTLLPTPTQMTQPHPYV